MEKEFLKQKLVGENMTMAALAREMGVSRQRVFQLVKQELPELHKVRYRVLKKHIPFKHLAHMPKDLAKDTIREMSARFTRKRQNSKQQKWEWAIEMKDLDWPIVCPILGIELDWFADSRQDNSPSFDRVDNTKGYIPGNVQIISWRANRIKNDGTALEHQKIADFLNKRLSLDKDDV